MEEVQQDNTATSSEAVAKETPSEEKKIVVPAVEKEVTGESATKKAKVDYSQMSTRPYLDATVVPILLQGLSALARERPSDPIQYLADFLVRNKGDYNAQEAEAKVTS